MPLAGLLLLLFVCLPLIEIYVLIEVGRAGGVSRRRLPPRLEDGEPLFPTIDRRGTTR